MEPTTYRSDPAFEMPHKFLPNEVYAEAIESMVIVVADVIFVDRSHKKVFLATRKARPIAGLWVIGGRLFAGEGQKDGIVRIIKRETSLPVVPERLNFLCMNRYINHDRQQEPQDKGSDSLSYIFALELTDEERAVAAANLEPDEYEVSKGLQEFDIHTLEALPNVHPAVLDICRKALV